MSSRCIYNSSHCGHHVHTPLTAVPSGGCPNVTSQMMGRRDSPLPPHVRWGRRTLNTFVTHHIPATIDSKFDDEI